MLVPNYSTGAPKVDYNSSMHSGSNHVENFGGNISWQPADVCLPRTEADVLQLLAKFRGRKLRAVGRLHSWSAAARADDVLVELRFLNAVSVRLEGDQAYAEIGAGCQIKHALAELRRQGEFTFPTLGLISEQTIAGATATGTHGSGRHSLSHYVHRVRLATYDPVSGEPVIRVVESGAELEAARCGLGCLGIVTAITLPLRRQYQLEEHFCRYDHLDDVLAAEDRYPLQQFYLTPWRWDYFAQHRREVQQPRSWLAPLYRLFWSLGMDRILHLVIILLARWLPNVCTRVFCRWILPCLVPQLWRVVDRSDRQLLMGHHLFRHIEIETFVTKAHLPAAIDFAIWLLKHCGGQSAELPAGQRSVLEAAGIWPQMKPLAGQYHHHYAICIRKVQGDATLLSMASGAEPYYALSFISYARPHQRDGFLAFATALAQGLAVLVQARPHWGKVCPLNASELARLYPRLDEFRRVMREFDPTGAFQNEWTKRIL